MVTYILWRTDQDGGYVAQPGSKHSYTHDPLEARKYPSIDAAEFDRCKDNEVIMIHHAGITRSLQWP